MQPPGFGHLCRSDRQSGNPESFSDNLLPIPWKATGGEPLFRQMETKPSPPRADFRTWSAHATCQMLEMSNRVSKESMIAGRGRIHDPHQCPVRWRIGPEHCRIRSEIRHPRLVELEHCLRWLARHPLGLRVAERVEIVFLTFEVAVPPGDGEIMPTRDFR